MPKSSEKKSDKSAALKMVLRFEKSKELHYHSNVQIIDLFKQTFILLEASFCEASFCFNGLSLASTNQKHDIIGGVDYLFFSVFKNDISKKNIAENFTPKFSAENHSDLVSQINLLLSGKIIVSNIFSASTLITPNINKYAYYKVDLSDFELPTDFYENLVLIMTRDTNFDDENISVTEITYKKVGNSEKEVSSSYHIIELIHHIYYDQKNHLLYFIADGNSPAYILLAGLIYGRCKFSNGNHQNNSQKNREVNQIHLSKIVKITRLDYVDSTQKITHSNVHYDNVLGDYIQRF